MADINSGTSVVGSGTGPRRLRTTLRMSLAIPAALMIGTAAPGAAEAFDAVKIGTFIDPVYVTVAPGKKSHLYIVERAGRIVTLKKEKRLKKPFLDIRDIVFGPPDANAGGEQGLLSVAFPADHKKSMLFYVAYTNDKGDLEIDEFKRKSKRSAKADPKSRREVITIRHRDAQNHNGGQLQFGPDGYLYIGTGDGGGGGDQFDNARKLNSLSGKILRIDPKPGRKAKKKPYKVPKSNPFKGKGIKKEIFAYGLRNPWRFGFDGNSLLIGDVGQSDREEVDILPVSAAKGANFGWPQYEGDIIFDNARPGKHAPTFPQFVYDHDGGGCSITGGYIVRDPSIPSMAGRYVYGDYCLGDIRTIMPDGSGDASAGLNLPGIASFGMGFGGQLYTAQLNGTVSRLEAP